MNEVMDAGQQVIKQSIDAGVEQGTEKAADFFCHITPSDLEEVKEAARGHGAKEGQEWVWIGSAIASLVQKGMWDGIASPNFKVDMAKGLIGAAMEARAKGGAAVR